MTPLGKRLCAAAVIVAGAIGIAACGGGGASTSAGKGTLGVLLTDDPTVLVNGKVMAPNFLPSSEKNPR